jgi:hypothetical protein
MCDWLIGRQTRWENERNWWVGANVEWRGRYLFQSTSTKLKWGDHGKLYGTQNSYWLSWHSAGYILRMSQGTDAEPICFLKLVLRTYTVAVLTWPIIVHRCIRLRSYGWYVWKIRKLLCVLQAVKRVTVILVYMTNIRIEVHLPNVYLVTVMTSPQLVHVATRCIA